jgi:membrane fusion protein
LAQQRQNLERRLAAIDAEIGQFSREIEVQTSRLSLTAAATERLQELERLGFSSQSQVQQQQEQELEQKGRLRQLERARAERGRDRVALKSELDDLPLKSQAAQATLARDMQALEQEMAESEARRETVVTAPQSGTVTAIQTEAGGAASTTAPILSIVPLDAPLVAHLFAPSRSVGFVRPGQKVLLRYQAYPYQKFGHYRGTVESVSQTALSPSEVPAQLTGLSSLTGSGEPIYRIVVRLERQDISAYGKSQSLSPGMQLESDVLLETRKLWEWMLEPLITLSGKL